METTLDTFSLLGCAGRGDSTCSPKFPWRDDCPYCRSALVSRPFSVEFTSPMYRNRGVRHCTTCGWWGFDENTDDCNNPHKIFFSAILQSFDLRAANVPVAVLELELKKWIENIRHLNPKRMEDLMRRILSQVWDCEVRHMGYSKDGGTDLIILNGNAPVAVQVRRRTTQGKGELVSAIREFLGAGLLSGHQRLMYVTTAETFTSGAQKAAKTAVAKQLVEAFELVSMREIRAFLPKMPNQNPWDFAVKRANDRVCDVPNVPNPFEFVADNCGA